LQDTHLLIDRLQDVILIRRASGLWFAEGGAEMAESFITTTRGLRRDSPALRLFEKAKRLGVWNPSDIDLSLDVRDWVSFSDDQRDLILRLTSMFQAGEEAVTLDLLPLVLVIAREGRLEEEMYLATFLWEESKHTDFFRRFLDEVAQAGPDLSRYHSASYRTIFYEALPEAMSCLLTDPSPAAQARAVVVYNMVAEGVLAETGYHGYVSALERNHFMPGQCRGIQLVKQDETRHIAYGVYLLSRLLAEDGSLWEVIEKSMNDLLPLAMGVIGETFSPYDPMPFDLDLNEFTDFALRQFDKRILRVERSRGASLEDVHRVARAAIEQEDA
jgi:ribonucleoside-diphosphate reductase beta chain